MTPTARERAPRRNVFTIYCHGTDFHRDKDPAELIDRLSSTVVGPEARIVQTGPRSDAEPFPFRLESDNPTHLICEGPGSESGTSADGVNYAHPGRFNPITGTEKGGGAKENPGIVLKGGRSLWFVGERQADDFQLSFMGNTPKTWREMGLALGRGWDDNVYKAVWMLTHLKFELGQPIDTVNIVGWSRGAVTCIKIANKLFEVFEDTLKVNICAVDPVPGGYTPRTTDIIAIPPNVDHYLALLALDADGGNFQPTDRDDMGLLPPQSQHGPAGNPDSRNPERLKPKVHFVPFPGNHSDLVGLDWSHPLIADTTALCRGLAWRFLDAHGTAMGENLGLTPDEALRHYEALLPHLAEIARAASSGGFLSLVEGFKTERAVRRQRQRYVADPAHYINEHHRLCALGAAYPRPNPEQPRFADADSVAWGTSTPLLPLPPQTHPARMGLAPS